MNSLVANTAEEKHTPTPWQFSVEDLSIESGTVDSYRIDTAWDHGQLNGPAPVVTLGYSVNSEGKSVVSLMIRPEDAAFIVLACNSFDALTEANAKLLAAIERTIQMYESYQLVAGASGCGQWVNEMRDLVKAAKVTP